MPIPKPGQPPLNLEVLIPKPGSALLCGATGSWAGRAGGKRAAPPAPARRYSFPGAGLPPTVFSTRRSRGIAQMSFFGQIKEAKTDRLRTMPTTLSEVQSSISMPNFSMISLLLIILAPMNIRMMASP